MRSFAGSPGTTSVAPAVNTFRQLLVSPNDPAKKEETCGVVYRIHCEGGQEDRECHNFSVGETGRTLKTWVKEHQRPCCTPSMASSHLHLDGRPCRQVSMDSVHILDFEDDWTTGGIKESIYIRMLHLDLNVGGGRHDLPLIWDNLLEVSYAFR